MVSRREFRWRSKSRPPAFDSRQRQCSLYTSTSRLLPVLRVTPPSAGFAAPRPLLAQAQEKSRGRRKTFRAASPCLGDLGWPDLRQADSIPELTVRWWAVQVCLPAWSRSRRRQAAAVPARSLSLLGPAVGPLIPDSELVHPPVAGPRARCHTFRKSGNCPNYPHRTSGRSRWFSRCLFVQFNSCQQCHCVRPFILECHCPVSIQCRKPLKPCPSPPRSASRPGSSACAPASTGSLSTYRSMPPNSGGRVARLR